MSYWSDDPISSATPLKPLVLYSTDLEIPEYQRPLAWGDREAAVFLQDLLEASRDTKRKYSLGVVYLAKTTTSKIIVDGQQRLTTLACLMVAIGNTCDRLSIKRPTGVDNVLIPGSGQFRVRFWSNVNDHVVPTIIDNKTRESRQTYITANASGLDAHELQIMLAISAITSTLEERLSAEVENLSNRDQEAFFFFFVSFLSDGVTLIEILIQNEQEGTSFFENLNNRGVPLKDFDVIRNQVYRAAHPSEKASLAQLLNQIVYTAEPAKWCKNPDEYAQVIKWCLQSRSLIVGGKNNHITDVVERQIAALGGARQFVDSVKTDVLAFKRFWDSRSKRNDPLEFGLARLMDQHKFEILAPLIIALEANTNDRKTSEQVIYAAFLYILRSTLFDGKSATDCAPAINKLIELINNAKPKTKVSEYDLFASSASSVKLGQRIRGFDSSSAKTPAIVTILYLIEVKHLAPKGTVPKTYGENLNLEHIAPKIPKVQKKKRGTKGVKFDPQLEFDGNKVQLERFSSNRDKYDRDVYRLGNLCLLDSSVNKSIKNECLYAKCLGHEDTGGNYQAQDLFLVAEVLKQAMDQFNKLSTDKRLTWTEDCQGILKYENMLASEIEDILKACDAIPEIVIQ